MESFWRDRQTLGVIGASVATVLLLVLLFVIGGNWLGDGSPERGSGVTGTPAAQAVGLTPVATYTPTPATLPGAEVNREAEIEPSEAAPLPYDGSPFPDNGQSASGSSDRNSSSNSSSSSRGAVSLPATASPFTLTDSPTDQLLADAARLHRYGLYADERRLLERFLTSNPAVAEERLARYRLAESFLADGQLNEALTRLNGLIDEAGGRTASELSLNATFLRAEALAQLGRYDEALTDYLAFVEANPELAASLNELIGETYRAAGNWQAAGDAYTLAAARSSTASERARLLEQAATSYESGQLYAQAGAAYDEILSFAVLTGYRTGILYRAGSAYAADGDDPTAVSRWESALAENPDSNPAYQSLVELINRNVPVDDLLRGQINVQAEAYFPAIRAFESVLAANPEPERRGSALVGLGQAHSGLGEWPQAVTYLERVINELPGCTCFDEAWLTLGRLELLRGDGTAGRRVYRTFAREYPADSSAAEALWRSALSAISDDNPIEAGVDLLTLVDAFPQSERAPSALFVLGIGAMESGLYTQAVDSLQRLVSDYPQQRTEEGLYWLGRAYAATGDRSSAQVQWQRLAALSPESYYGVLAQIALLREQDWGTNIFAEVTNIDQPASTVDGDDGSQAFAEQWLADWLGVAAAGLSQLSPELAQDQDLLAGERLLFLDRRGLAMSMFRRVYDRYIDDPAALYALALHFQEQGAYSFAIISAEQLIGLSPAGLVQDAPAFIQRIAYPRPFRELVEPEANANQIDPLLFFSLLRQESLFEEGARSFAAAQGLAQIIPTTGQEIAQRLNFSGYSNELIYRPYLNLRFGAFYLAWTRNFLEGDTTAALAGYNAGPGNGRRWQSISDDDTFFVELMDYSEPRLYIQRILSHYYHYTRLYGG